MAVGGAWWSSSLTAQTSFSPMPLSDRGVSAGQRLGTRPATDELLGRRTQTVPVECVFVFVRVCIQGLEGWGEPQSVKAFKLTQQ